MNSKSCSLKQKVVLIATISLVLLLTLISVACAGQAAQKPTEQPKQLPNATVKLDPTTTSIKALPKLKVTGTGFIPNKPVIFKLVGKFNLGSAELENPMIGSVPACDKDGAFAWSPVLADIIKKLGIKPGTYTINAEHEGAVVSFQWQVVE